MLKTVGQDQLLTDGAAKYELVVDHLRSYIRTNGLRPGDRLPAERDLAQQLGITRGNLRRGLGYLAALGILEVRHGTGAFLVDAAATLGNVPIEFLRAIGGFDTHQMFEARRVLESELASLAAERCREEQFSQIADELTEMYATVEDPGEFLVHDVRFHRIVAQASGNPILTALMEVIAAALYEERQRVAETRENRVRALDMHRAIYRAIRTRNPDAARVAMTRHLHTAEGDGAPPS